MKYAVKEICWRYPFQYLSKSPCRIPEYFLPRASSRCRLSVGADRFYRRFPVELHIKEYILFGLGGARIVKYGYNYLDEDGNLVFRYDNALDPMARDLSTYPEHRHSANGLSLANRPLLEDILEEISERVRQRIRA